MDSNEIILSKLSRIEKLMLNTKKILSVDELADYTGYSKSTIYKLVQRNVLPFSKPNGKQLFFSKERVDEWLLSNSASSDSEIKAHAEMYIMKNKKA